MSSVTADLRPDLVDWPHTRPVGGALVGVINTLRDQDRVIATLDDLAELLPGRAPQSTARALREAGWLFGMRTRGVWGFSALRWGAQHVPEYMELHARLRVRPDTPACIAGETVAMLHGWLWRPVESDIGMPPGVRVPRCLGDFGVHRWEPRIGLDQFCGLPMWKPETLLCYMAARPSRICWEDVNEWLWAVCENLELDLRRTTLVWHRRRFVCSNCGERHLKVHTKFDGGLTRVVLPSRLAAGRSPPGHGPASLACPTPCGSGTHSLLEPGSSTCNRSCRRLECRRPPPSM